MHFPLLRCSYSSPSFHSWPCELCVRATHCDETARQPSPAAQQPEMIALSHVTARAGNFMLTDVSFDVPQGAYGIVIGPAGAGKTTLLETIAGAIPLADGVIHLGGENVSAFPPERRRLGIVYQHAYLFPHLTVRENVEYGAATSAAAHEMADRFGVDALADRAV